MELKKGELFIVILKDRHSDDSLFATNDFKKVEKKVEQFKGYYKDRPDYQFKTFHIPDRNWPLYFVTFDDGPSIMVRIIEAEVK